MNKLLVRWLPSIAIVFLFPLLFSLAWDWFLSAYVGLPPLTWLESLGFWLLTCFAFLPLVIAIELLKKEK